MKRATHLVVFRPTSDSRKGPLAKPWPQVSYVDARTLRAAITQAARRYFPDLTRVDVTFLGGSWRECTGQAYVTTPRGAADLQFFPAGGEAAA